MALPPLTPEQRAAALEKAAAARRERAAVKNKLKYSSGSLAEVRQRISAIRLLVEQTGPAEWADADALVDLTLPNGVRFLMSAEEDIRDWILPNFYFHVTMAYALLRNAGLVIGKMDFIPHMARYRASTAE